eukprot:Nitzschia sp. Nitz4//scaffold212_size37733//28867//30234//NITZ4_007739-RA/size37733-processed-gene-0.70-mRNA-1//-1//CDS//3329542040//7358//frame0
MVATSSTTSTRALSVGHMPWTRFHYAPPCWAQEQFDKVPTAGRLHLANLPTPLVRVSRSPHMTSTPGSSSILEQLESLGIQLYLKRDDMTGGCETGGNKIRKLEFLLADALEKGYSSVVTIGGEQSNHCRATAGACRMVGLEPHLILRTKRANQVPSDDAQENAEANSASSESGFGFVGNILFDRLVGSTIYTCTPGEYGRIGSAQMVSRLCTHLESGGEGKQVYPIPVGGSNGIGTWGYIEAVEETLSQWNSIDGDVPSLDHVVVACGSGGSAAGVSLGMALAHGDGTRPSVHAIGVCDNPDYFYKHMAGIADEMGLRPQQDNGKVLSTEEYLRNVMTVHHGKGLGYAVSTPEELQFITDFALETGVVLDPVYTGKALHRFFTHVLEQEELNPGNNPYKGKNILFWHTGGALGLFDKGEDMLPTMARIAPVKRLDIYGKGTGNDATIVDISAPV